jgi:hypothetical protein
MNILRVQVMKILNFKSARPLLSTLLVREAKALLCEWRLELGGVGNIAANIAEYFSDLSQISTILEHGFYVRAILTST